MEEIMIDPESLELATQFAQRYTRLQLQKKSINRDVKELRKEYEEQGLPTGVVIKAFTSLRKDKKDGESAIFEMERYKEWMLKSKELIDLITELDAKD